MAPLARGKKCIKGFHNALVLVGDLGLKTGNPQRLITGGEKKERVPGGEN